MADQSRPPPSPASTHTGKSSASCSRCGHSDRELRARLAAAEDVVHELEKLLDWLVNENRDANLARERAEDSLLDTRHRLTELRAVAQSFAPRVAASKRTLARARTVLQQARGETGNAVRELQGMDRALRAAQDRIARLELEVRWLRTESEMATPEPDTKKLALAVASAEDWLSRTLDAQRRIEHEEGKLAGAEDELDRLASRLRHPRPRRA